MNQGSGDLDPLPRTTTAKRRPPRNDPRRPRVTGDGGGAADGLGRWMENDGGRKILRAEIDREWSTNIERKALSSRRRLLKRCDFCYESMRCLIF